MTDAELTERRTIQDWVVRPLLRGIPGVADINSIGGYEKQYRVIADPDRLRHYGVTLKDVYTALANNNANSGGGVLRQYAEQYLIRGIGLIESLEDIGSIVLKERDGTPVFVRDVAEVKFGHAVRFGAVIKNGDTESVGGIVLMIRGGNAKEIVTRVKARVKEINAKGMLPDGLKIVPYYDRTDLVDAAIWTVSKVLIEGIALVIIVLFLFLGDIRSSLIVVVTLIVTPLVTFMVMIEYGISANLMSLGGLAIAIGMMVDGSVVVVENTFRHLGEARHTGESRSFVVLRAATEVGKPVLFGVGIICLVLRAADDAAGHGRQDVRAARLCDCDRDVRFPRDLAHAVAGLVLLSAEGRRGARHAPRGDREAAVSPALAGDAGESEEGGFRRAAAAHHERRALPISRHVFHSGNEGGDRSCPVSTAYRTCPSRNRSRWRPRRCASSWRYRASRWSCPSSAGARTRPIRSRRMSRRPSPP